jgi:glycerophosphoryl diester phosphodiesterase
VTLSADGVPIVSHEPIADPALYRDTGPVAPGDRLYPYVGRPWHQLDLRRIRTLDAGAPVGLDPVPAPSRPIGNVPGAMVPTLAEVLACVVRSARPELQLEIEIKHHVTSARFGPGAARLAARVVSEIRRAGMAGRCRIRSFDWRVLIAVRALMPELRLVALATAGTASRDSGWTAGVRLGRAPWARSLARAAADLGAGEIAPEHSLVDAALVTAADRCGLRVVPWTVNDPARAQELVELGVDGLTTDRPDLLRPAYRLV